VAWPIDQVGAPVISTATLCEREQPFELSVELARGKLNDVRNQCAEWEMMGQIVPEAVRASLHESLAAFATAVTLREDGVKRSAAAQRSLEASAQAGRSLVRSYTDQVLAKRLEGASRLGTQLGVALGSMDAKQGTSFDALAEAANSARIRCSWARVLSVEGKPRWDETDAQLQWCRKRRLTPSIGPLIDFRPGALPEWIWLWDGDFDQIQSLAVDFVRQAVSRYRGKVSTWHIAHRLGEHDILGLREEAQIRLLDRLISEAHRVDSSAQIVIDLDRPWAEWMATNNRFQIGPLHLADTLARADHGLRGLGVEIAPGYTPFGSHLRDVFDLSRLLDLYSLIDLPLHVTMVIPSSVGPDEGAEDRGAVDEAQWPRGWDEAHQRELASEWIALAVAKPFVRSVTWLVASDGAPGPFPHGGLLRADGQQKPLLGWMRDFRRRYLG
jgi:hypothetical protein